MNLDDGIRQQLISARYIPEWIYAAVAPDYFKQKFYWLFWYGVRHPGRGKVKPKMDVPKMVAKWLPEMLKLATAHDKDEQDEAEAALDDLLSPLLAAPVAQLREFYSALVDGMKADRRFPMVIWRVFEESWGEHVIAKAPDEAVMELKEQLARDVIELCERDAKEQLPEAMVRALMWRAPERLRQVKSALKAGGKAKIVGRESCLYLEIIPKGKRKAIAQVML
jgi:hypothetical protein